MLKQMRKPAATSRLEAKANVVVHAHGDHGRDIVRYNHDAQPIAQRCALNRDLQSGQRFSPVSSGSRFRHPEFIPHLLWGIQRSPRAQSRNWSSLELSLAENAV